jgi:hypothetical protein
MSNLNEALAEISAIRSQIARETEFRGYGPASVAASGIIALIVAMLQTLWLRSSAHEFRAYLALWIATAAISLALSGTETVLRARRVHSSFANEMIYQAAEQFLPALIAGLLLTVVVVAGSVAGDVQSGNIRLAPISTAPNGSGRHVVPRCGAHLCGSRR